MKDLGIYLPGIIAAYSILVVGASSPGPSVAMLIGLATGHGRRPALVATLGIATGSMTINILTIIGVGILLSQTAWLMSVLRLIGAAYLLYLAYSAFRKAINPPDFQPIDTHANSTISLFVKGYLLQITNPKTISFWLAIASVGAVDGANIGIIVLFVFGAFCISFLCHGVWVIALSAKEVREKYKNYRRRIETILGSFLAFAAYRLGSSD